MARTLRDSKLDSREARSRLKIRGRPYWRLIQPGLHIGFRKLAGRPGTWCVRRYEGHQSYSVTAIKGVADDYADADGATVLSFAQAQREALKQHKPKAAGPLTVRACVESYLVEHLEGRGGTPDAIARAEAFIYPTLGDEKVEALTGKQLRAWHMALAKTPPRVRTGKGKRQQYAAPDNSDEGKRRRKSSANRVLVILKGALNFAFREGLVTNDAEWRRVKAFEEVNAARIRYLTVAEAQRLINACSGEFRRLVQGALATGMRYGELARVTVGDFNPEGGSLLVHRSKSGKPRHVILNDEGRALFASWCAGRASDDLIFRTGRGERWTASLQGPPMREACRRAGISGANFHALRHTYASLSIMAGVPLMVTARNLGHADTRMCELHYGHLAPSFETDAIRAGAPRFGFKPDRKVTPLAGRR
jgi:integrase